jgi:hypothetical protein
LFDLPDGLEVVFKIAGGVGFKAAFFEKSVQVPSRRHAERRA